MTLIGQYTAHQRYQGFSPRTVNRRAWSLGLWEQHLATNGATVTTATVDHLVTFLARWPSAQSRYSIRSDVHQLYQFIGDCPDPTASLKPPKLARRDATPIPATEVRRLLAQPLRPADRLMVMFAACAGLRVSEIAAVRGEDVDLEGRWLTVTGKGGHRHTLPLAAELAVVLEAWPRHGPLLGMAGGSVSARIRTLFRRHKVVGRPHDLRHSFATETLERTGDVTVVKELMRHAEVATTMRYLRRRRLRHDMVDALYDVA